ncbi:LOW QUALITY PROTEIN: zinc finger protein 862-like [Helicoverpa armigera]|uniref:LOW QUALITY PROTEIN: zinc finger protein 862-like n=1 Tax=Helicoverpa armigera TaxID=29058 RepID=UPI0030830570
MALSKQNYVRRYRKEWESDPILKGWLTVCIGDDTKAWCKACKCTLVAHKKDLVEHSKTKKHDQSLKRSNIVGHSSKMSDFFEKPLKEPRKVAELKIAAYVAEHSSIKSVDHLGILIKDLDPTSPVLKDLKLHRSKCTALIRNVISPCYLEELLEEVGDIRYSIIVDETTTVDTKKVMCMIIKFFSEKQNKIITQFYRLIEIESADATSLTDVFKAQLIADGLNPDKLLGIGVDGANVMVGEHHSFSSILKESIPELITIKCVCHSLHLAAENAFKTLPRFLDFLQRIHNWFSNSTKRQIEYKEIYKLLYEGKKPLKINKLAGTRWLSRYEAVVKISEQWEGLKLHFDMAKSRERCYTADQLSTMLKCKAHLLYMTFLGTYLKPITMANKLFQATDADPLKLLEDVNNLLLTYLTILIPPAQLEKAEKHSLCNYDFEKYVMDASYMNFGEISTSNIASSSIT